MLEMDVSKTYLDIRELKWNCVSLGSSPPYANFSQKNAKVHCWQLQFLQKKRIGLPITFSIRQMVESLTRTQSYSSYKHTVNALERNFRD